MGMAHTAPIVIKPIVAPANPVASTPSFTARENVLDQAKTCVLKDRNATHGNPEDNFKTIAGLCNVYLTARGMKVDLQPYDIAIIMDLVKTSRIATSPDKEDHWVDKAGYAACGAGCVAAASGPLRK